jgi:hypothetical protein
MSLEEDLKSKALALISQQMANWVVEIQRAIADRQASFVKSLDELQETAARYDERIDEEQIGAAMAEVLQGQALAPGGGGSAGVDRLKASLAEIEKGVNLSEVLTHLVNESAQFLSRAAIFIIKGANAIGWYARGFDTPETVKQINVPLNADTVFRIVSNSRNALRGHISHSPGTLQVMTRMGGNPQGVLAVPLILREKVAAVLYCDSPQEELPPGDADAVEILVQYSGKVIDLLSLAPKTAKPAPAPAPAPRPAPPPPPPTPPAPPPVVAPAPAPAADEGSSTVMFDASTFAQMKQQAGGGGAPAPAPAPAPPPVALSPQEQEAHEKAKRFARLVVSEIKLYNEAKVNEGRQNKDIYERLKEEIERGRQMYSDRIPANVRDASNYFYDELVRILAGGDPTALGPM